MKLFDKFKEIFGIAILSLIMILIIILYGTYRCKNSSFKDPFTKTIFPKPLKNYLDGWGLFHFLFYALLTSLYPNYWIHIFIIGILWEIIETSVKNKPFYIGKCNVNISTDELNGWWYGRYEDIIMNSFGQLFGYWIANKGITSFIFIPLYIIVILFQIYMIK